MRESGHTIEISIYAQGVLLSRHSFTQAIICIGRHNEANLCLSHRTVSRHHATLRWQATGLTLIDEQSKNGISVNDEAGTRFMLNPGDSITIGPFILRVRILGEKLRKSPPEPNTMPQLRTLDESAEEMIVLNGEEHRFSGTSLHRLRSDAESRAAAYEWMMQEVTKQSTFRR